MEVLIGDGVYMTTVMVSAMRKRYSFINGAIILAAQYWDVLLRQNLFTFGEHKIDCITERVRVKVSMLA